MQEVYDRRILHNLLGLKPQPSIVNGSRKDAQVGPTSSSAQGARKVVQSAWQVAEPDVDLEHNRHQAQRRPRDSGSDEEEGRYNIGRQPPKKRRKTGRVEGAHTVFTTDDEDDERHSTTARTVDSLEEEEGEYASDGSSDGVRDRRRSYWLSKGRGIENGHDSG